MQELVAKVSGRVQGVGYRAYVQRHAVMLSLVGFARNMADGSVEVIAQGTSKDLRRFVTYLYTGSRLSQVDNVQELWREPTATYSGFHIR